mmetsp:Transcript_57634/g.162503  ORF Transcript_57634/g.162503 Transcript_57634/m.162503 type:complete len:197 (-) Transcript_57634:135-725(-)
MADTMAESQRLALAHPPMHVVWGFVEAMAYDDSSDESEDEIECQKLKVERLQSILRTTAILPSLEDESPSGQKEHDMQNEVGDCSRGGGGILPPVHGAAAWAYKNHNFRPTHAGYLQSKQQACVKGEEKGAGLQGESDCKRPSKKKRRTVRRMVNMALGLHSNVAQNEAISGLAQHGGYTKKVLSAKIRTLNKQHS